MPLPRSQSSHAPRVLCKYPYSKLQPKYDFPRSFGGILTYRHRRMQYRYSENTHRVCSKHSSSLHKYHRNVDYSSVTDSSVRTVTPHTPFAWSAFAPRPNQLRGRAVGSQRGREAIDSFRVCVCERTRSECSARAPVNSNQICHDNDSTATADMPTQARRENAPSGGPQPTHTAHYTVHRNARSSKHISHAIFCRMNTNANRYRRCRRCRRCRTETPATLFGRYIDIRKLRVDNDDDGGGVCAFMHECNSQFGVFVCVCLNVLSHSGPESASEMSTDACKPR